jgi:hypothetical protein
MAYPGVLLVDDATIFRGMSAAGEEGGLICMHAENGIVIDEIVRYALEKGHTAPKYHALTRPTQAEAEGVNRAIRLSRNGWLACLYCAPELPRRPQAGERSTGRRHSSVCRNLPPVPFPRLHSLRKRRF